jgi:asparagine synthase (glutamine-hydrolysing)
VRSAPEEVAEPLTLLEVAAGLPLEPYAVRGHRPPRQARTARAALEAAVLDALRAGPVSVSFSGGRDSSLVLAVAVHVARREGLPAPVPITMCHDSAESRESDWQERVLRHLRVEDWVRVDVGDRMDALGGEAMGLLAAYGLQSPANAYLHLPVVAAAGSGTVLTGVGGDELLGSPVSRAARVRYGGARPRPRDALSLLLAAAPYSVRRRWRAARTDHPYAPWLTPAARAEVVRRLAAARVATRLRWDVDVVRFVRSRSALLGRAGLQRVGARHGVRVLSPLMTAEFADAFASESGPVGPGTRSEAMRHLASDLLPEDVLTRTTKAVFGALVWGPEFRRFVSAWSPDDLDPHLGGLVDPVSLHAAWSEARPLFPSMLLAQHAWLRSRSAAGGFLHEVDGVRERVP